MRATIAITTVALFLAALYLALSWQVMVVYNALLTPPRVVVLERTEQYAVYPSTGEAVELPVVASWYGPGFVGNRTANGETFTAAEMTAAHRDWPFGTWVELRNPSTGKVVAVRINDRGPYIPGRDIDLSAAAAKALGMIDQGTARLEARVLSWGDDH